MSEIENNSPRVGRFDLAWAWPNQFRLPVMEMRTVGSGIYPVCSEPESIATIGIWSYTYVRALNTRLTSQSRARYFSARISQLEEK
jgi:hypothetical protein